jgi:hypothetical protein
VFLTQLTLACALAFAVEEPQTVRLPGNWPVGTAYHVEFTKSREDIEEGKPTKRNSSRTPIDVEIVAKREDGYTVRWTFGRPVITSETPIDSALVERISTLVEGLKLDMLTDATGSITKLADPAVMDTHFERAAKILFEEIEAQKSLSPTDLASLKKTLAALKGPNLQASYLNFPRVFYMPAGAELTVGEKREYEDHLPNPFGGDPLPSKAYLVLTKVNASAKEAVVDWRQTIDPAKAGPILEASIRALAKRTGQEIPQEGALSFDAVEDASTYVYDLTTGIPKSVVTSRTTMTAGRRRIDTQEFVVSARPPK